MYNMNIHVIRCALTKSRNESINTLLKLLESSVKIKVNVHYVDGSDPDMVTKHLISRITNYDKTGNNNFDQLLRPLNERQVSNTLKHLKAIVNISKGSEDEFHLVLEDDVVFGENIVPTLLSTISSLPKDYGFAFTGLPSGKADPNVIRFIPFDELYKIAPSCESYFVTPQAARLISQGFTQLKFCTNIQLSYIISKNLFKTYLVAPNLFIDGSKLGAYVSTIDVNNSLWMNPDYHKLKTILANDTIADIDVNLFMDLINACKFKNHPDFQYLYLQLLHKINENKEKIHTVYEVIYSCLKNNNCVLNNESIFLKDYIRHFAQMQT